MTLCLIWSNEHRAWWKPGSMGYTPLMAEAGRYTEESAKQIVLRAQLGRGKQDAPPEIMVRLDDARATLSW